MPDMHMWMWFGYDLGDFLFSGLNVSTRWQFALTWIVLFVVAVIFEGSKVYLAGVQRAAHKKLHPYRSDERRNLLCDREPVAMEATTSRNTSSGQVSQWASLKVRMLVNTHQTLVFLAHNVVGYLLMLAVMLYNVHLLLAVVFGMMLGYFLFGTKLTRLQMQCIGTKRVIICTPECDDTAESTTPPLLNSSGDLESATFACQTRTCIQPSHYFPASTSQGAGGSSATCYYGAKKCPSKVLKAKKLQSMPNQHCHHAKNNTGGNSIEDTQLLKTEHQRCCKEPPPKENCCKSSHITATVHENEGSSHNSKRQDLQRENSPQITCCHNTKMTSESQEQIVNVN